MLTDFAIYFVSFIIHAIAYILPSWQVWPQTVTDGLSYFMQSVGKLNFFIPIDTLFSATLFFISFKLLQYSARITIKIIGFFRGTNALET